MIETQNMREHLCTVGDKLRELATFLNFTRSNKPVIHCFLINLSGIEDSLLQSAMAPVDNSWQLCSLSLRGVKDKPPTKNLKH